MLLRPGWFILHLIYYHRWGAWFLKGSSLVHGAKNPILPADVMSWSVGFWTLYSSFTELQSTSTLRADVKAEHLNIVSSVSGCFCNLHEGFFIHMNLVPYCFRYSHDVYPATRSAFLNPGLFFPTTVLKIDINIFQNLPLCSREELHTGFEQHEGKSFMRFFIWVNYSFKSIRIIKSFWTLYSEWTDSCWPIWHYVHNIVWESWNIAYGWAGSSFD